ncbi:immunity protein Imm33 domain-containing protein [Burkholderia gladioli]|uniref:immunity protein Imm33 domain-containing protein n=1 Tax=Burkholderia gladioli TaxID=28095 RepID=UPI003B987D64
MIFRSNFDEKVGHSNFIVSADEAYDSIVDSLFEYLEGEIKSGKTFGADQTIQFGWMILMLKGDGRGDLEVWEPDFSAMPINWEFSLNKTFRDLYLQRELCAQAGLEPDFPSLLQRGIISPVLDPDKGFIMNRETPQNGESGWFFLGCEDQGDKGRFCSLFEVAMNVPWVTPFLALPPGVTVACNSSAMEIRMGSRVISSNNNEILRNLFDRWRAGECDVLH